MIAAVVITAVAGSSIGTRSAMRRHGIGTSFHGGAAGIGACRIGEYTRCQAGQQNGFELHDEEVVVLWWVGCEVW